jgi:hypothetical protein
VIWCGFGCAEFTGSIFCATGIDRRCTEHAGVVSCEGPVQNPVGPVPPTRPDY